MRMIGFIPKTLPADKKKGTSEEKCIFYPHDTLTDIFMIAFDEIWEAEAKKTKSEA